MLPRKGSCLCGALAYEIDGEIDGVWMCHCSNCRKASGGTVASWQRNAGWVLLIALALAGTAACTSATAKYPNAPKGADEQPTHELWCGDQTGRQLPASLPMRVFNAAEASRRKVAWRGPAPIRLRPNDVPSKGARVEARLTVVDEMPVRRLVRVLVDGRPQGTHTAKARIALYVEAKSLVTVTRTSIAVLCSSGISTRTPNATGIHIGSGVEVRGKSTGNQIRFNVDSPGFRRQLQLPKTLFGCTYKPEQVRFSGRDGLRVGTPLLDRANGRVCVKARPAVPGSLQHHGFTYVPIDTFETNGNFTRVRLGRRGSSVSATGWVRTTTIARDLFKHAPTSGGVLGRCPIVARLHDQPGGVVIGILRSCGKVMHRSAQWFVTDVGLIRAWIGAAVS